MGIKDLSKILKKHNAMQTKSLKDLNGKIIGVDTSCFLYKFSYFNNNHIVSFIKQLSLLNKNGVKLIYVFDGIPDAVKDNVINERRDAKEKIENEVKRKKEELKKVEHTLSNSELKDKKIEIFMTEKKSIRITDKQVNDLQKLFKYLSVPYIVAKGEADPLLCKLCDDGIIDGVLAEDMDMLTYGATSLLTGYKNNNNMELKVYEIKDILDKMDISMDQFRDMCILLGCDYLKRLPKCGPVTVVSKIKKLGDIESIVGSMKSVPDDYLEQVVNVRKIFKEFHGVKKNEMDIVFDNYMVVKNNGDFNRIKALLKDVKNVYRIMNML